MDTFYSRFRLPEAKRKQAGEDLKTGAKAALKVPAFLTRSVAQAGANMLSSVGTGFSKNDVNVKVPYFNVTGKPLISKDAIKKSYVQYPKGQYIRGLNAAIQDPRSLQSKEAAATAGELALLAMPMSGGLTATGAKGSLMTRAATSPVRAISKVQDFLTATGKVSSKVIPISKELSAKAAAEQATGKFLGTATKQMLAKKAAQLAVQAPIDATTGAAFGVAQSAMEGNTDNLGKNILSSAALSAGLPIAAEGVMTYGGAIAKPTMGKLSNKSRAFEEKLVADIAELKAKQNVSKEIAPGVMSSGRANIDDPAITKQIASKERQLSVNKWFSDLNVNFTNRARAPQRLAEESLANGGSYETNNALRHSSMDIGTTGEHLPYVSRRMAKAAGLDFNKEEDINVVNEFIDIMDQSDRFQGVEKAAEIQKGADLLAKLSPEKAAAVQKMQKDWVSNMGHGSIDQLAVDATGMNRPPMDPEEVARIKAAHPNYSRFDARKYFDEEPGAFSTPANTVTNTNIKAAKGHAVDESRISPLQADMTNMAATEARVRKSNLFNNALKADQEAGLGKIVPLWTHEDELAKNKLITEMTAQAGAKDALLAEMAATKRATAGEVARQSKAGAKAVKSLRAKSTAEYFQKAGVDNFDPTVTQGLQKDINAAFVEKIKNRSDAEIRAMVEDLAPVNQEKARLYSELKTLRDKLKSIDRADAVPVYNHSTKELWDIKDRQLKEFFKGEPAKEMPKLLSKAAGFTRAVATQFNPGFQLKNKVRDVSTTGSNFPFAYTAEDEAIGQAAFSSLSKGDPNDLALEALKLRAIDAGMLSEMKGNRNLMSVLKGQAGAKGIEKMNERAELSTRLGILAAAKRNGITDPNELRNFVRQTTTDFRQGGKTTKYYNQIIPFLNARVTGLRTAYNALEKDPSGMARRMFMQVQAPEMLLAIHNKTVDQHGSLARVPDSIKNQYYIVMTGEKEAKDKNGNTTYTPQYVTIPKGESQQLVSGAKRILDSAKNEGDWSIKTLGPKILGLVNTASPISGVPTFGGSILDTASGLGKNVDWRGQNIESPYDRQAELPPALRTSKTYSSPTTDALTNVANRVLGGNKQIGSTGKYSGPLSPARVNYALSSLFAGTGKSIYKGIDAAGAEARDLLENKQTPAFERLNRAPVSSEFFKTTALSTPESVIKMNKESAATMAEDKYVQKASAQDALEKLKTLSKEDRTAMLQDMKKNNPALLEGVKKLTKASPTGYWNGVNRGGTAEEQVYQLRNYIKSIPAKADKKTALKQAIKEGKISEKAVGMLAPIIEDLKKSQ